MSILIFIVALVLFVSLVVLHELGHAIVARRNGVVVEEFGIGFPPMAWSRKLKNGVLFTLNWLPLGGFVRLKGENDNSKGEGAYGVASLPAKARILMAGVVVNWLTAVVIFSILAVVGMPRLVENQFNIASDNTITRQEVQLQVVAKDSPAEKAGLRSGDIVSSLAGQQITGAQQVTKVAADNAGKTVDLTYLRDGQSTTATVQLNERNEAGKGILGVTPTDRSVQKATWSAPIVGVGLTAQLTGLTFEGLWKALSSFVTGLAQFVMPSGRNGRENLSQAGDNVSGPVGIFVILKEVSGDSFALVLYLIGVISLTLAVMNALPIPALDGGRLFVTLYFRARRKVLTKELEEKIHGYGFTALLGLIVLITIVDVKRFF